MRVPRRSRARALVQVAAVAAAAACGDMSTSELQIVRSTPDYGPLIGGSRITLSGAGFLSSAAAPTRVLIGGREAPLVAPVGDSMLEIVIPPGEQPGDAELLVFNAHGNVRATGVFHYSAPPAVISSAPTKVLYSSTSTRVTLTGSGFLDEAAGDVSVLVDGQLAADVLVASDTSLTFTAPPGRALSRPDIEVVDARGTATERRAFRYVPSMRPGLLLFPIFGAAFAVLFDPIDNSTTTIPRIGPFSVRMTAVVLDQQGEYWGFDRNGQFGRLDMTTQTLEAPIHTSGWFPTLIRVGGAYLGIERGSLHFGRMDPVTGSFSAIGTATIPCCGSYGLASDGTTLHFTARQGTSVTINTIDAATGATGTPVTLSAAPGFHVEEMRFFDGVLYASSRDNTLVTIDPGTGATTVLPVNFGRCNAMEIFE